MIDGARRRGCGAKRKSPPSYSTYEMRVRRRFGEHAPLYLLPLARLRASLLCVKVARETAPGVFPCAARVDHHHRASFNIRAGSDVYGRAPYASEERYLLVVMRVRDEIRELVGRRRRFLYFEDGLFRAVGVGDIVDQSVLPSPSTGERGKWKWTVKFSDGTSITRVYDSMERAVGLMNQAASDARVSLSPCPP